MNLIDGGDDQTEPLAPMVVLAEPDPHTHSVQFYGEDAFLIDRLGRFVGSAIVASEPAIVLATRAHRDALAARLTALGIDVDRARRSGQLIAVDAADALAEIAPHGWPEPTRFVGFVGGLIDRAAVGTNGRPRRPAIFGELVALLSADGNHRAAVHLEHLWNDLAKTRTFSLYCAYPMSCFASARDSDAIGEVCAAHAHVIPAEGYSALHSDDERDREIARLQQRASALETEIAERMLAQNELKERNEQLRAAVSARDEFISIAAHELKTPITSLRAFAQLLLRDLKRRRAIAPARLTSALDAIEAQTGKLSQLLSRLLDTSQIESGRLQVDRTTADLVAVVRAAVAQLPAAAANRVEFDGPERLDVFVDPVRIEQVVANLLDNAVKFSTDDRPIQVELRHDAESIRLSVTDHGIGIPIDQQEAIFGRFHQAHGSTHQSGLGLGLYVSREIVERHGGEIHWEQPAHKGSRFVVTLPVVTIAPAAECVA